jgi:hypothetical protein
MTFEHANEELKRRALTPPAVLTDQDLILELRRCRESTGKKCKHTGLPIVARETELVKEQIQRTRRQS